MKIHLVANLVLVLCGAMEIAVDDNGLQSKHALLVAREQLIAGNVEGAISSLRTALRTRSLTDGTLRVAHEAYSGLLQRNKHEKQQTLKGVGGAVCRALKGEGGARVLSVDPLVATVDLSLGSLSRVLDVAHEVLTAWPETLCLSAKRIKELQTIVRRVVGDDSAFQGNGRVCDKLTSALDAALVGSDSIVLDVGADAFIDDLDAAMSRALGFENEFEAYAFSTHAQITSYRPNRGFAAHIDCHDFSMVQSERVITAILYATDEGETVFPVLNISVKAKQGRMLVFHNMLPDGTCDPAVAHASPPSTGKVILQKWFYDRGFDRKYNAEGIKERPVGYADCDLYDCRRYERLPATDDAAILRFRQHNGTTRTPTLGC